MRGRSMRGVEVDMSKYMAANESTIAVGNANMNARGDMIDRHGRVIKAREVIAQEYHKGNPRAVKKVMSIKDLADRPAMTVDEVNKALTAAKTTPEAPEVTAPAVTKKQRRLSE